jgi:hypothetical protein
MSKTNKGAISFLTLKGYKPIFISPTKVEDIEFLIKHGYKLHHYERSSEKNNIIL